MAKINPKLKAEVRNVLGKKVKHLRTAGITPATVYGNDFKALSIQVDTKELNKVFDEVGESGLVDLEVDGKTYPVLFRNPQYHPVEGNLIHIDGYKVNLKEKITATVPIEFVGESPAVKAGNVLIEVTEEVEVEALPADLPEKIEVDISKLENLDQQVTVADLVVDKSRVEIKTAADQVVVKLEEPKEEVIEEPTVAPGDVPATEQKAPDSAEATEGEKPPEEEKKES